MKPAPEIADKLKGGDRKAYEDLFLEHYKNLVLYAKKFVMETELSRDIVQDVFIYLWEKRQKISIEQSVSSYLYRAVRNACINHLKRDTLKKDYVRDFLLSINHAEPATSHEMDAHELIVHNDLMAEIESIVESLPDQCQNIFRMSRYKGLKNKEIAAIYSISPRTVETQIYRALKVLKENLAPYLTSAAILVLYVTEKSSCL